MLTQTRLKPLVEVIQDIADYIGDHIDELDDYTLEFLHRVRIDLFDLAMEEDARD